MRKAILLIVGIIVLTSFALFVCGVGRRTRESAKIIQAAKGKLSGFSVVMKTSVSDADRAGMISYDAERALHEFGATGGERKLYVSCTPKGYYKGWWMIRIEDKEGRAYLLQSFHPRDGARYIIAQWLASRPLPSRKHDPRGVSVDPTLSV